MNEPKNYKKNNYYWGNESTGSDVKIPRVKKCGCKINYRCGCRGGEAPEEVFDLVDEMNLRHGKKRGRKMVITLKHSQYLKVLDRMLKILLTRGIK